MPQAVTEIEQMGAVVARQRVTILAEIGDVVQPGCEAVIFLPGHGAAARVLALAEIARKDQLLLVADVLIAEQQHGVFIHAGFDILGLLRGQWLAQIDAGDLAEKMRVKLPDRDSHGVSPDRGERLPRSICVKNYSRTLPCQRVRAHARPHALRAIRPPSTGMIAPVRNDAAGRHRLSVMWATSSGSP